MFALRRGALSSRAFSTSARNNYAKITLIGHLADTPELQVTSTGHQILKYAVASNSGPSTNRHTSWFRVAAFTPEGPQREFLQSLPKGTHIYVEGEAKMDTFEGEDGKPRSVLNLVQRHLEVLKRPDGSSPSSTS